jgi:type 1 glutamine amidotransferase
MRLFAKALLPAAVVLAGCATTPVAPAPRTVKLLIVTGGHGFQAAPFYKMFADDAGLAFTAAAQDKAAEVYDRPDLLSYDAVLLYDAPSEITDAQKAAFLSLFENGIGVVVLHHALLSYQKWPVYERAAGGKYLLDVERNGERLTPESTYEPSVEIPVHVAATGHPVIAGLQDFTLKDELYHGVRLRPDVRPLLTTGSETLAWTRLEGRSRVVGTVLGHGPSAYEDPRFLVFLRQAIRWVAKR